ncbi:MAG: CBS domain-containing protein [Candidatus Thorarchaeota archaeon]
MTTTVEELRRLRLEAGVSQSDLADEIGVSQAYIARVEKGTLDPKLSIVESIIRYLGGTRGTVCSDIMVTDVEIVDARDSVYLALSKMRQGNYSQLPVVRGTRLVGCVTASDVIRNIHLNLKEMTVEAIMNPEGVPMMTENTPIAKIIPLLQIHPAVIIQKQGRLSGIITSVDLLNRFRNGVLVL